MVRAPHKRELVLASASPRRRELLASLGVEFSVAPANIDESVGPGESPQAYVRRMALAKARAGLDNAPRAAVLGSDTAVVIDGRILGKPRDQADAIAMLGLLSDTTHEVLSGVALATEAGMQERLSITTVSFRAIEPAERLAYWLTGEPADKAGGYAIQGLGAVFVREIRGSYSGVVGLPLFETAALLTAGGYRLILDSDERRDTD